MTVVHGGTGMFPSVPGHEGAGIVEAVGPDVTKFKQGDRVGITFTTCGQCKWCKMGRSSLCDIYPINFYSPGKLKYKGRQIPNWFGQSSFSTETLTTEANLTKVPEGIDPDTAGPYGCGVMTGVGSMMQTNPSEDKIAMVFGLGTVGMSSIMGAKLAGCWDEIKYSAVPSRAMMIYEKTVEAHFIPQHFIQLMVAGCQQLAVQIRVRRNGINEIQ